MNTLKIFIFLIFALFLVGCSGKYEVTPQRLDSIKTTAKIVNLSTNKTMDFDDFIVEVLDVDILLVGELHDDFDHHLAEILLIKALSKNKNIDVAFEMLGGDKQKYADGLDKKTRPGELIKTIKWNNKMWELRHYKGVLETAFYSANIKCANLSEDEIKLIFAGAQPISGKFSTSKSVQEAIVKIVRGAHGGVNKQDIQKLVQAQQYKDRRMADVVNKSANFALLIAGRYHVQKDIGVPLHLMDFKTKKKFKTLFLGFDGDDTSAKEADYLWKFK